MTIESRQMPISECRSVEEMIRAAARRREIVAKQCSAVQINDAHAYRALIAEVNASTDEDMALARYSGSRLG